MTDDKLDEATERAMRRAARAVLDAPGMVEKLAAACVAELEPYLSNEPEDERRRVRSALQEELETIVTS